MSSSKVFVFNTRIGSFKIENSAAGVFAKNMIERYADERNIRVYWRKKDITELLDSLNTKLSSDLTYYEYFRKPNRKESIQRIPSFSELLINYLHDRVF